MLRGSEAWSDRYDEVMNQWFSTYLKWLTGSKMGAKASAKETRHGSWYYFQTSALAWYLQDEKTLARQIKRVKPILRGQFNSKGGQPEALKESDSYARSCFNLDAMTGIGVIAEKAGKKFWSKNKSVLKGLSHMMPVAHTGEWSQESDKLVVGQCIDAFNRYAEHSGSAEAKAAVSKILTDIASKEKKSSDEKRIYNRYALFKPQLVSQ